MFYIMSFVSIFKNNFFFFLLCLVPIIMLPYGDFEYVGICISSTKYPTGKHICDPTLLKFGMAVNIG